MTLSRRELEVLRTFAQSDSTEDAARRLGISPNTVRNHLERIRHKLGVKTTIQAAYALFAR